MANLRRLAILFALTVLALCALTIRWQPGQAYGGAAVTDPLPVQQVIEFAPLTSQPFYAALRDSQKRYGCTTPQEWRKVYHSAYPVTMIVQGMTDGQPNWHLTAKPWSFKHIGGYVRLLCPQMTAHFANH